VGNLMASRTWGAVLALATAVLIASPSPATAAVTLGQVGNPSASTCAANLDLFQVAVASGNPYFVPGAGTLTSWTMFGGTAPATQQFSMKVFRKVAEPSRYQAVGHTATQTVTLGGTAGNTFPANIAVKAGDVIGLHNVTSGSQCAVGGVGSGFQFSTLPGDLADGSSDDFPGTASNFKVDVEANFVYDNSFTVQGTQRNKKKGTETITLNLPNPGELSATGNGAKVSSATAQSSKSVGAGAATLVVKAQGKKRRKLNQTGKVKLSLTIAYTPTGGTTGTQSLKVKLKKKL
jgi:hypothetical protein